MSAKTDYLENAILNYVLLNNVVPFSTPGTVYVGLFTQNPTDTGSLTNEVSGTGYVRKLVTFSTPAGGVTSNDSLITFPAAGSGGWGTVSYFGILDESTSGNMLYHGPLDDSRAILEDDVLSITATSLSISEL